VISSGVVEGFSHRKKCTKTAKAEFAVRGKSRPCTFSICKTSVLSECYAPGTASCGQAGSVSTACEPAFGSRQIASPVAICRRSTAWPHCKSPWPSAFRRGWHAPQNSEKNSRKEGFESRRVAPDRSTGIKSFAAYGFGTPNALVWLPSGTSVPAPSHTKVGPLTLLRPYGSCP